ncbi:MAG: 3-dehydroquinate synthase [Planctomycetota bacterium]|jgi:3-dehydroquinate synthase
MRTIDVTLPGGSYRIQIEAGLLESLGEHVRAAAPHDRALLAVDARIASEHGGVAESSLVRAGYQVVRHELEATESAKTRETVGMIYDRMLEGRLQRGSPVVALGGGIVGDVAGFAAATFHRGVPLVQTPTTLLAMVDAAIGGKTGVNYPIPGTAEPGKNLVGSFWQPRAVLVDPLVLRTLAAREWRCGLAECVKHALIADADLLQLLEDLAPELRTHDASCIAELVARSAGIKVAIVERDEREGGERALLNLGHTFAHVVEPIAAHGLKHGEAVAIGLCAAGHCSVCTGRQQAAEAAGVESLLERLGLPTRLGASARVDELMATMRFDKKMIGGGLRLVLPVGLGGAEIVDDVPPAVVESAWRHVGAD